MNIFCVSPTYVAGFLQGKGEMHSKLCAKSMTLCGISLGVFF